jgi:hypothetical protein
MSKWNKKVSTKDCSKREKIDGKPEENVVRCKE